jgi:hypothetical protein
MKIDVSRKNMHRHACDLEIELLTALDNWKEWSWVVWDRTRDLPVNHVKSRVIFLPNSHASIWDLSPPAVVTTRHCAPSTHAEYGYVVRCHWLVVSVLSLAVPFEHTSVTKQRWEEHEAKEDGC